jgi:hypothetical protein
MSLVALWRQVVAGTDHDPGSGQVAVAFDDSRDPEVREFGDAFLGDEDVVGLDVAMDHTGSVGHR